MLAHFRLICRTYIGGPILRGRNGISVTQIEAVRATIRVAIMYWQSGLLHALADREPLPDGT